MAAETKPINNLVVGGGNKEEFDQAMKEAAKEYTIDTSFPRTEAGFAQPKSVITVVPKSTYLVPTFRITDEGVKDADLFALEFCKGSKSDPNVPRQSGFFTETLIQVCIQYLKDNNVGELENEHTTNAILHFETGLYKLDQRVKDRIARGVQQTYNK